MPQILRTRAESPYSVEVENVGVLGGSARGGIPVERAAQTLRELQDERGRPLSGQRLAAAAKDFAKARGLQITEVKSADEERLRVEGGAFPAGLSIEEISRRAAARDAASVPAETLASEPEPDEPSAEAPPPPDQPATGDKE